jgi:uncharacterized protein YecA (UPF0149 family)
MENNSNNVVLDSQISTGMIMDSVANTQNMQMSADEVMNNYVTQGNPAQLAQFMPRKPKQMVREHGKIGRNDLCPCGSGKKYKKCCLSSGEYENLVVKH